MATKMIPSHPEFVAYSVEDCGGGDFFPLIFDVQKSAFWVIPDDSSGGCVRRLVVKHQFSGFKKLGEAFLLRDLRQDCPENLFFRRFYPDQLAGRTQRP